MVIAEEKVELRKYFKRLRSQLTAEQAASGSLLTARQILACDAYRKANCIMGYLAFGNELSVDLVLQQALCDGKTVAVPLVQSVTEMAPVQLENMLDFELDRYGIRSVRQPAKLLQPQQLDLVLVPGVAFGRDGSRLGMGAGYYDRFLPLACNAVKIALCRAVLLEPVLPRECHDVRADFVLTEDALYACKGGG